jgi:integrase
VGLREQQPRQFLIDAEVRPIRFHDLRHTFATIHLLAGKSVVYVKEQLGHSSVQITCDIYGHYIPGGNREFADDLDDKE